MIYRNYKPLLLWPRDAMGGRLASLLDEVEIKLCNETLRVNNPVILEIKNTNDGYYLDIRNDIEKNRMFCIDGYFFYWPELLDKKVYELIRSNEKYKYVKECSITYEEMDIKEIIE